MWQNPDVRKENFEVSEWKGPFFLAVSLRKKP
jgi:hypothetical protein